MKRGMGGLAKALAACGAAVVLSTCGSSGSGSCGKVAPCGGDIVGNWKATGACANAMTLSMQVVPGCTDVMASSVNIQITGNASFNTDGTYTLNETTIVSGSGIVPASCLQLAGVPLTCSQFDLLIQQYIATDPTAMVKAAHCSGNTDCSCTFTLAPQVLAQTGTYNTLGSPVLTLNANDGIVYGADYCVQKNELHLIKVNATMPMGAMGQANIDADTVFTKD